MERTIIIYDQCGTAPLTFYVVDKDVRHLEDTFVNAAGSESREAELLQLIEENEERKTFPNDVNDAHVIVCGFLP